MKDRTLRLSCEMSDIPYMDELLNLTKEYLIDTDNLANYRKLKRFINSHLVGKLYLIWSEPDWNPSGEWNLFQMYRFFDDVAEFHLVYRDENTHRYSRASDVMACFSEDFGFWLNQDRVFDAQYVDIELN